MSGAAERRICVLCGRAFALVMPPGEQETERDKLCPVCLARRRRQGTTPNEWR
jgi:hypothetical protein